jgi:hypothetical protein
MEHKCNFILVTEGSILNTQTYYWHIGHLIINEYKICLHKLNFENNETLYYYFNSKHIAF